MDLYWKGSAVKVPTLKLSDDKEVLGVTRVPLRAPPPTGFGLPWTPDVAAFPAATQRVGGKWANHSSNLLEMKTNLCCVRSCEQI